MQGDCRLERFLNDLKVLKFENAFNPYSENCVVSDNDVSSSVRTANLRLTLQKAVQTDLDAIWLGRDLGYRGGRRTGLALTDESHLDVHGYRWGVPTQKATVDDVVEEQTARAVWEVLHLIKCDIFPWNVYPLHPFPKGSVFSNRAHTSTERRAGEEIFSALLELLRPKRIIAIGNDAARSAKRLCDGSIDVQVVRHPSYGGRVKFRTAMLELYNVQERLWRES